MTSIYEQQIANFRTNVRVLRREQRYSQGTLAEAVTATGLKMLQQTVYRIERGSRAVHIEEALAIASVLGQQLEDMLVDPESVGVFAEDESPSEGVGLDTSSEGHVDGLSGVDHLLHRFDELLVEVRQLAIRVNEVHGAVSGDEVVTLDVDRVASDVERKAKARGIILEAIEQGVVESTNLLCTPGYGDSVGVGVTNDDAGLFNHDSSLTGHGANLDNAPTATTEAATSVVGDIVRDGTDDYPEPLTSVEKSDATGAAAPSQRPHPKPPSETGNDHELLFIDEAAALMKRTPASLRAMVYEGKAPNSAKIGKRRMFRRSDVEAWIDEQFSEARP